MVDPALIQSIIKEGKHRMDLDKEFVQVVAIVGGVTVAVAAMIFDGEVGNAVGTLMLTGGSSLVSYYVGTRKKCPEVIPNEVL